MASLQDLENAIDVLLNHPLGISQYQLVRRVEEKAYEAFVFGLCLRATRELGVTPVLRGNTGAPAPFVFRGAPGTGTRSSPSTDKTLRYTLALSLRERAE